MSVSGDEEEDWGLMGAEIVLVSLQTPGRIKVLWRSIRLEQSNLLQPQ